MVEILLVTVMFHPLQKPSPALQHRQEAATMSKTPRSAGSPPQAPSRNTGKPVLPRDIKVMLERVKHNRNKNDLHHLLPGGSCNNPAI